MTNIGTHATPNDTEETRAVVGQFLNWLQGLEGRGAEPPFTADARFWVAGDHWWSGEFSLDQILPIQRFYHSRFINGIDGLQVNIKSVIVEGFRAAVELDLKGDWHDGRTYIYAMHLALVVKSGMIDEYRDYGCDTGFLAREEKPSYL